MYNILGPGTVILAVLFVVAVVVSNNYKYFQDGRPLQRRSFENRDVPVPDGEDKGNDEKRERGEEDEGEAELDSLPGEEEVR